MKDPWTWTIVRGLTVEVGEGWVEVGEGGKSGVTVTA